MDTLEFSLQLENNIFGLRETLLAKKWKHDPYVEFLINDPKLRRIHKATVRDRVLYQAVYRILYRIFDPTFIFDSYSSRRNKGTHAAVVRRLKSFLGKASHNSTQRAYCFQCDIKKFFDSIDHTILLRLLREKIDCRDTMHLLEEIIESFSASPGKGLPLGNVTSQLFANVYLNSFDWFVKSKLKILYYIRYCDDFIIVDTDRGKLEALVPLFQEFLREKLLLELHPNKISIRTLAQGIDFLGYVTLPHHRVLRTKTKKRMIRNLSKLSRDVQSGFRSEERLVHSYASYLGVLGHCRGYAVEQKIKRYIEKPL